MQWCRRIINEETARASAGNLTDFDPAGLISAVTIAQKWRAITTPEAEDAIRRSLIGGLDEIDMTLAELAEKPGCGIDG